MSAFTFTSHKKKPAIDAALSCVLDSLLDVCEGGKEHKLCKDLSMYRYVEISLINGTAQ